MKINIGDWIRFYQGGVFVIGVVEYIETDVVHDVHYCTSAGRISAESVLEVRCENITDNKPSEIS